VRTILVHRACVFTRMGDNSTVARAKLQRESTAG
jgi:hypothetical protein